MKLYLQLFNEREGGRERGKEGGREEGREGRREGERGRKPCKLSSSIVAIE